jgi:hypothetical protein
MAISFTNLIGSRENLDKTIRYQLQTGWVSANVSGVTPKFYSDTEESDNMATVDEAALNSVRVNLFSRERTADTDVNGDDKHTWKFRLLIEIQGESLSILTQMEDEVNRILWTLSPNTNTRLNKSDGSASEVAWFEESELTFNRIQAEGETDFTPISQAELICIYFRIKT